MNKQQRIADFYKNNSKAIIQTLANSFFPNADEQCLKIDLLREDLMFPELTGNKYRKLKYTLLEANDFKHVLTFGGPFSNHIHACSVASEMFNFQLTVLVRDGRNTLTPTLSFAKECGAQIVYLNPSEYRLRQDEAKRKEWLNRFQADFFIQEGGAGELGIKGCEEILQSEGLNPSQYDYIIAMGGTGTMLCGVARSIESMGLKAKLLGVSALKKARHLQDLLLEQCPNLIQSDRVQVFPELDFGGIGRWNDPLIELMSDFDKQDIQLDQIYTAKLMWYVRKWVNESLFEKGAQILLIHSGGQQGRSGLQCSVI